MLRCFMDRNDIVPLCRCGKKHKNEYKKLQIAFAINDTCRIGLCAAPHCFLSIRY